MAASGASRVLRWWPALLAPLAIGAVLLTRDTAAGDAIRAHDRGPLPPTLPLLAAAVALVALIWRRNPLLWLIGALGVLFFLREASMPGSDQHLPGAKKGVYVGLLALVVWAYVWRERLGPWVRRGGLLPASVVMWGMYVLSQVIARGGLKFVSDVVDASGRKMRTPMEEACETVGHLLLLGIAIAASMTRPPTDGAPVEEHTATPGPASTPAERATDPGQA